MYFIVFLTFSQKQNIELKFLKDILQFTSI